MTTLTSHLSPEQGSVYVVLVMVREVLAVPCLPEAGSRCPAGTQSRWQGPVKRTTASINQLHLAGSRNMDAAKESHQPTLK